MGRKRGKQKKKAKRAPRVKRPSRGTNGRGFHQKGRERKAERYVRRPKKITMVKKRPRATTTKTPPENPPRKNPEKMKKNKKKKQHEDHLPQPASARLGGGIRDTRQSLAESILSTSPPVTDADAVRIRVCSFDSSRLYFSSHRIL